jgi:glycosyltransferase involved in cell wall biosynthesis
VPDVTVIVPTRNRVARLRLTLKTVTWQRDVDLEVIVVDDGSVDGTMDMVSGLGDDRIRVIRNDVPLGESGARNRGIEETRAPLIAFLDDDDLWAPDKLTLQIEALGRGRAGWVYGGDVVVDEALNVLYGAPPPPPARVVRDLVHHNAVPAGASNVVVDADVLSRVGLFDTNLRRTADWDMWLRLARVGPPTWVPVPVVANCTHPGSISRDMTALFTELDVIAHRYGIQVDRARHYRWAAWSALSEGRRGRAARLYGRAITAGDVASIGRAAAVMLGATAIRRRPGSGPRHEADSWIEKARAWLDLLSSPQEKPGTTVDDGAPPP